MTVTTRARAPGARVAARPRTVSRHRGRRRVWSVTAGFALFSLGGLAWLAVNSSLLDVDEVRVLGLRRLTAEEVLAAARVGRGEPLLFVDRGAVAGRVERLAWVRDAVVVTELLGRVEIRVTEREPLAWVRVDGGVALVDRHGVVLAREVAPPGGLVELRGVGGEFEPGSTLDDGDGELAVAGRAPVAVAPRVSAVERRAGEIVVWLGDGTHLLFGRVDGGDDIHDIDAIDAKWAAAEAVLEHLGARTVWRIDVRVPTAPVVREDTPAGPAQEGVGG